MAAQGRSGIYPSHIHHMSQPSTQSHLIKSVRQGAAQMAEYYHHSNTVPNGRASPPTRDGGDKYYPASRMDGRRIPSMDDPLRSRTQDEVDGYTHSSSSSSSGLPSGHFIATPVKIEDGDITFDERIGSDGVQPALTQESRTSTATRVQLMRNQDHLNTSTGSRNQFWRNGLPDEKRTRVTGSPHRRHNTSPDNKYFVSSQGSGADASRQPALTTKNVRTFSPTDHALRRSNSNSTLNDIPDRLEYHHNALLPRREYGSTSSIDVQSVSGESFFQMLQDYQADPDQRSPAPPQLNRLLQGKVKTTTPLNDSNRVTPAASKLSAGSAEKSESKELLTSKDSNDNTDFGGSPKITRKQSKRNKKNRTKSVSASDQSFFKKKLRSSMKGSDRGEALEKSGRGTGDEEDISLEDKMEERMRQLAFQHYDVQSTYFDLQDVVRNKKITGRKRNTTTGASAASRHSDSNTPEGSLEDLLKVEQLSDDGDGRGNLLIHSCPFFRNEIGDEVEPRVSFSRIGMLNARTMHREKHRAILESETARQSNQTWKGPVIEFVDHGAMYYRKYFYGFEHHNYFGLDENYGPVAVSIRREMKVEDLEGSTDSKDKDAPTKYRYRIIVRTSELVTLRGLIAEDSIPSTSKHNSPKGLPLKDVLEYVVPDLPLACLRLALATTKVSEQLLKLDEQGVSNKYKVGIMLCKTGQNTEEEMYNNEHSTLAFDEFLDTIGERIRLKGFDKYRAQLDNKSDSTGTHSVYASYQNHEIMFHVSTLLPFTANNRQQLLRKRHIGNDIVTIVFQEPGAEPFTPKTIRSQFQHVFVVVQAIDPNTDNVFYSVAVTRSKGVSTFGPPLPANATFPKGTTFIDFLLAKVINAENVVHKSEKFIAMATRTKREYLKDLAENSVTTTTVESGAKSSKFSLSHKKKEKTSPHPAPDFHCKGALVWRVEVYRWSPIWTDQDAKVDEFSLSDPVECICAISPELFTLIRECSRGVIFSIPCKAIIGWTDTQRNLKLYFNEGNCVRMCLADEELDEVPEVVKRLDAVTSGVKTQEITLLRNSLGQLGFHVHYQGIVVEVDPYGWAWQAGLRKGARLVEICEIAVCTQTHEEMIDLLRTSQTVKVLVVPPHEDGSARRGSTPIDYDATGLTLTIKTPFNRSHSNGKGSYRAALTITRDGKSSHSRSATTPETSSHTRTPSDMSRLSNDPETSPSNAVRNAIASLERRISHQPKARASGQHPYRDTVNYWKEVNHANRLGHSGSSSGHGTLESRGSRDGPQTNFARLANERRSAREYRPPRLHDVPTRLRSSQEELEQISSLAAVRQTKIGDSREELRGVATQNSTHSRQNSMEDKMEAYPRGRVFSDSSQSPWHRTPTGRLPQSATFPETNRDRTNPSFATPNSTSHYRGPPVKHLRSGDTLTTNTSEEKWYDTQDDINGYHDSRLSGSHDNIAEPSYSTGPITLPTSQITDLYGTAERYSPTGHLYPEPTDLEQRVGRPAPITTNVVLPAPSNSNLSDVSLHSQSTHSSGSSQRGDYRELGGSVHLQQGGSLPRSPIVARSPELSRRSTVQGVSGQGRGDYVSSGHRRAGPSASSSSSISETSSPRVTRRRTAEVRSSNDSLNTRLRQGLSCTKSLPANNEVQDSLRKLIAPDSINAESAAGPSSGASQVNRISAAGASAEAPHQAALPREHAHTTRPSPLHRTYSDESIAAGGGPYNRPPRHDTCDLELSDDLFSSAKTPRLEVLDNQLYKEAKTSSDDLNANNNRGDSNPLLFPLPDSAGHLDWHNLVQTANAFQDTGLDQHGFKSVSSNKLHELSASSQKSFHSNASLEKKKQMSQSTDALSPSTSRRGRPQAKGDYDSVLYKNATYDPSAMKRSAQQLEKELHRTRERLETERKQKEELSGKVHKLMKDNKRLAGESASTAEQLQLFTDWYFSAIDSRTSSAE